MATMDRETLLGRLRGIEWHGFEVKEAPTGVADRASVRLAMRASARETCQMVEHLLVNRFIESADEASEHVRIAPHILEILAAAAASGTVAPDVAPDVTPEVFRMLGVIDGEMGLSDEKHFREHYQQPAVAQGLVEMTIPDKPKSSRQKYRLTDAGRALLATPPGARS